MSRSINPRARPGGVAYNAADTAMFTDVVKKRFNVDGKGVTVGVMSDSYNCLGTAATDVSSGDLPADVKILKEYPFCADGTGTDEGRAMLQLIHDVAPGAKLLFYTASVSAVDFASGIQKLAAAGADIIVDDIGYFAMPMFQEDPIAQSVNEVKAQGVTYFSAAGNNGRLSYQNTFVSGKEPLSFDTAHDFGRAAGKNSDFYQHITIPTGTRVTIVVQWDDPAELAGGSGAKTDLDVFLLNSTKKVIATSSQDSNIGHDPIELMGLTAGAETSYYLYVSHRAGPTPNFIKYIIFAPTGIDGQAEKPKRLTWDNGGFFFRRHPGYQRPR